MQASRKKIDDNKVRLTVSLTADEIDEQIHSGCVMLAYQSKISPVKDKTPYEVVVEKLGEESVGNFLDTYVMDHYAPFAIADRKIKTIGMPSYHSEQTVKPKEPFTFQVLVVECPEYSLDSYDPVDISVEPLAVTDADVDELMSKRAEDFKINVEDTSHDIVAKGDIVELDMVTTKDGERVEGLCSTARPYQTGGQFMPDGFDEAIIGMKVGEPKTFTFEGPSMDFGDDGEPLMEDYETTATVTRIVQETLPAVTDAWVKDNIPGCETVPQYQELLRKELEQQQQMQYRHYKNYLSASALAKRFDGKIPDAVYEAVQREQQQGFEMELARRGLTREAFFQQQGIDEQQYNMMSMVQMREQLMQQFCIDALARHENMKVTDADIDEFFHSIAPGQESQARRQFEDAGRMYLARESALRLKANDWLTEHANVTVAEPAPAAAPAGDAAAADKPAPDTADGDSGKDVAGQSDSKEQ